MPSSYLVRFNQDVDALLKVYDNLRLKANMPLEVIDDIDKNLIQVLQRSILRVSNLYIIPDLFALGSMLS